MLSLGVITEAELEMVRGLAYLVWPSEQNDDGVMVQVINGRRKWNVPKVKPFGVTTIWSIEITCERPASAIARARRRRSAASFAEGVKREVVISSPIGLVGH